MRLHHLREVAGLMSSALVRLEHSDRIRLPEGCSLGQSVTNIPPFKEILEPVFPKQAANQPDTKT